MDHVLLLQQVLVILQLLAINFQQINGKPKILLCFTNTFFYNNLNITIDINKYAESPSFSSTFISPGNEFYINVMDQSGRFATAPCKYTLIKLTSNSTNSSSANATTNSTSSVDFLKNNSTNKLMVIYINN